MARWKARIEFLLSLTELLFLSLTAEALQGKMCQNSLHSGGEVTWSQDFRGIGMKERGSYGWWEWWVDRV